MVLKKSLLFPGAGLIIKGLIFISTFYFLYEALSTENIRPENWFISFLAILQKGEGVYILFALSLIFFNWGLEARKWQQLAVKIEDITFWQAYRAVLIGICLGFITPNRIGDYAGRIMALQSRQRLEGLGAIFLGRFCQLTITVAAGSMGLFYFLVNYIKVAEPILFSIAFLLIIINAFLYILLLRPQILIAAVSVVPVFKRFVPYIAVITVYSPAEIRELLQLSFLRYLVFLGQFMLLLTAFGVKVIWWQMALGVSSTFLLKSVVPSLTAIADLGMRELSAIYVFSFLVQNKMLVMSASLSLWFINIVLPNLIGLVFVWGIKWKIFKGKKSKIRQS